jgi:hypothetical protein
MTYAPLLSAACASYAVAKMGLDVPRNQMLRIKLQVAYATACAAYADVGQQAAGIIRYRMRLMRYRIRLMR